MNFDLIQEDVVRGMGGGGGGGGGGGKGVRGKMVLNQFSPLLPSLNTNLSGQNGPCPFVIEGRPVRMPEQILPRSTKLINSGHMHYFSRIHEKTQLIRTEPNLRYLDAISPSLFHLSYLQAGIFNENQQKCLKMNIN